MPVMQAMITRIRITSKRLKCAPDRFFSEIGIMCSFRMFFANYSVIMGVKSVIYEMEVKEGILKYTVEPMRIFVSLM